MKYKVAPFVGAWIETIDDDRHIALQVVAPFVGAWIETGLALNVRNTYFSRTLCGCVD